MDFILKNKNQNVCTVTCDDRGKITGVVHMENARLLPMGVSDNRNSAAEELNSWWKNNCIPVERDSIRIGLECLGVSETSELTVLGMGLSLNNHYWLQPQGSIYQWEKINYYQNSFSKQVGEALFNHKPMRDRSKTAFYSPDASLNGMLPKKWVIQGKDRVLLKSGSGSLSQEPYNEVLASMLFKAAKIPEVIYRLQKEGQKIVCACKCFTDNEWEFIPGTDLLKAYPLPIGYPSVHPYHHYLSIMDQLHVPDSKRIIDGMLCIDYVIANTDRHYNNFGVLYNRECEAYKIAPMFDSGTSMYHGSNIKFVDFKDDFFRVRPFSSYGIMTTSREQIRLVSCFEGIDNMELLQILAGYKIALKEYSDMSEQRIEALCRGVVTRYNQLIQILDEKKIFIQENKGKICDKMLLNGVKFDEKVYSFMSKELCDASYCSEFQQMNNCFEIER